MARVGISIAVIMVAVLAPSANAKLDDWTDWGMTMSVTAYDAVCWYEYYKSYPDGEKEDNPQCGGQAQYQKNAMKDDEQMAQQYFGPWIKQMAMSDVPKEYGDSCNKYLDDPKMKAASDESDALNDPNKDTEYIFKGFAACMMSTLRKRNGEKAIDAVKNERTHSLQNWRKSALDKDNEFRARHGVEPFKRLKALDDVAQNWAQTMADKCSMYHSANSAPDRQYRGEYTGESIATGSGNDTLTIPYSATRMWYSEVQYYPFPKSCDDGACNGIPAVGHFTQTVWAGSKYVGYGYAYSPKCKNWFVAGRYYPGGNVKGNYKANVFPKK